jgi:hypothetical protein
MVRSHGILADVSISNHEIFIKSSKHMQFFISSCVKCHHINYLQPTGKLKARGKFMFVCRFHSTFLRKRFPETFTDEKL